MNVLLVYLHPRPDHKTYRGFPLGIGYLAATLERAGHRYRVLSLASLQRSRIRNAVTRFAPDIIGLSSTSCEVPLVAKLGTLLREITASPIVMGGVHATVAPQHALSLPGITAVLQGEAESTLVPVMEGLVQQGPLDGIAGLWLTGKPPSAKGCLAAPQVKQLPHPVRDFFNYRRFLAKYGGIVGMEMIASRGCPYDCSYCALPTYRQLYHRPIHRVRVVDDVVEEAAQLKRRYPEARLFGFHDDLFPVSRQWLEKFSVEFPRRVGQPFWCNLRPEAVDEQTVTFLERAGCIRVNLGIESGDEQLRKLVLKRNLEDEQIVAAFRRVKNHGMKTVAFNMVGIPYETDQSIAKTIALNRRVQPDWILVSAYQPYPGTALATLCREKGWLPDRLARQYYRSKDVLRQPTISAETIRQTVRQFVARVYR